MEERKIVLIYLAISLLGLALIYIASVNLQPMEVEISKIDVRLIGKTIVTSGFITHKKYSAEGHIFLTISDNKTKIQVPLFRNFVESLSNKLDLGQLKVGAKISITGLVDEYKGNLQIVPRKVEDLKLIG